MATILIIEDDPAIAIGLEAGFKEENYNILLSEDGLQGYNIALNQNPDLILLDLMLPNLNGLEICRSLRQKQINTPIIMLTCKKEEIDKVLGFEIGADDYVTKPFSIMELKMRVRALLKRTLTSNNIESFQFADFKIDFKKMCLLKNGATLELTVKEFQILKYMIEHEGEVISRNSLLDNIWGYDSYPTTRTVDNYILSLRKKIETDAANPKHIITIHTLGYKFVK